MSTEMERQGAEDIYVYQGEGSSDEAVEMLFRSLQEMSTNFTVKTISPEDIVNGTSLKSAALLAIGGGYDLGYIRALKSEGIRNIKSFVKGGGSYLGICAGAYFGCRRIEFDKGGELEVCGNRDLDFFPGVCCGPTFPGFMYQSEAGARAAQIETENLLPTFSDMSKEAKSNNSRQIVRETVKIFSYFNGGGHFVSDKDDNADIKILARYTNTPDRHQHPAVVRCKVGDGVAVLSGPHLEYNPDNLDDSNVYLKDVIPKVKTTSKHRILFLKYIVNLLKITV